MFLPWLSSAKYFRCSLQPFAFLVTGLMGLWVLKSRYRSYWTPITPTFGVEIVISHSCVAYGRVVITTDQKWLQNPNPQTMHPPKRIKSDSEAESSLVSESFGSAKMKFQECGQGHGLREAHNRHWACCDEPMQRSHRGWGQIKVCDMWKDG